MKASPTKRKEKSPLLRQIEKEMKKKPQKPSVPVQGEGLDVRGANIFFKIEKRSPYSGQFNHCRYRGQNHAVKAAAKRKKRSTPLTDPRYEDVVVDFEGIVSGLRIPDYFPEVLSILRLMVNMELLREGDIPFSIRNDNGTWSKEVARALLLSPARTQWRKTYVDEALGIRVLVGNP